LGEHQIILRNIVLFKHEKKREVQCEVISDGILSIEDKQRLYQMIEKKLGREVEVVATIRYRL